ncbi:MAG: GTP-binding protein, partial [Candidatus Hodarchaeota archaeon]
MTYPIVKCSIVGNGRVGKTSLCNHLLGERISATYDMTVGVSILTHWLQINGTALKLLLYDLAGQPHFKCVRPAFYGGTKSAVVVFSVTDRGSFYDVDHWLRELQNCLGRVSL